MWGKILALAIAVSPALDSEAQKILLYTGEYRKNFVADVRLLDTDSDGNFETLMVRHDQDNDGLVDLVTLDHVDRWEKGHSDKIQGNRSSHYYDFVNGIDYLFLPNDSSYYAIHTDGLQFAVVDLNYDGDFDYCLKESKWNKLGFIRITLKPLDAPCEKYIREYKMMDKLE